MEDHDVGIEAGQLRLCRPRVTVGREVEPDTSILKARRRDHRFPKPFRGALRTKGMRLKPLLCSRFRLSTSRIISHVLTPLAAQVRPREPALVAHGFEYPTRSLNADGDHPAIEDWRRFEQRMLGIDHHRVLVVPKSTRGSNTRRKA
jgi:hypothetical protein